VRILEHLRFSVRGFSLNRLAYLLDGVSLLLLLLYRRADRILGDRMIAGVAFWLMLAVLVFCLLTPRAVRHRWMPFLLGFIIYLVHGFFFDHL